MAAEKNKQRRKRTNMGCVIEALPGRVLMSSTQLLANPGFESGRGELKTAMDELGDNV